MRFSNIYREETIELLKKEKYDVVVIGGELPVQESPWMQLPVG